MTAMTKLLLALLGLALVLGLAYALWYFFGKLEKIYAVDAPGNDLACTGDTRFAVIGDFGDAGRPELDVAALVRSWQPDFIVSVGDNNYPRGSQHTIDGNIGRYYSDYIHPYRGAYGPGSDTNRFFPSLGNHDWIAPGAKPYLDYFTLPGNERYYDVRQGSVHLFILDSDSKEPDGRTVDSIQAQWLAQQSAASDAPWKLVVMHEPPYSSGAQHGSNAALQWDFAGMGMTAVLSGHEHLYERVVQDGILYIVNGLGGRYRIYEFGKAIPGSAVRYNQDYGAMLVTAGANCLNVRFITRAGQLIDSHTITAN